MAALTVSIVAIFYLGILPTQVLNLAAAIDRHDFLGILALRMTRTAWRQPWNDPCRTDSTRELELLEAELKRLEAEYNMFFAGRLPRPPWETRGRVDGDGQARSIDVHIPNYRRQVPVQHAAVAVSDVRRSVGSRAAAREEGRPGPFAQPAAADRGEAEAAADDRILHVTTFSDPLKEMDKLHELYDSLAEARREVGRGRDPVPQVRGPDQDAGRRVQGERHARSRVPRRGERRQGRVHRAGDEGDEGRRGVGAKGARSAKVRVVPGVTPGAANGAGQVVTWF